VGLPDPSTWHRLSDVDGEKLTATCSQCGLVRVKRRKNGSFVCRKKHSTYSKGPSTGKMLALSRNPEHRRLLKASCERCGFHPEHRCQLDAHHRDGNHHNNVPGNVMSLCANCHRLVHHPSYLHQFYDTQLRLAA
jgi:ribosomal protein L37AE/L43A